MMIEINGKNAIISVSNKEKTDILAKRLIEEGYRIFATRGTADYLRKFSLEIHDVEEISRVPEILGGRVKTLSSYLLGGVLAKDRNDPDIKKFGIVPIDLVYVEPYPFIERYLEGKTDLVEDIDIGGITLLRAAAKNFSRVVVIPGSGYIDEILENMKEGEISLELRRKLASITFRMTSLYDYMISEWFGSGNDIFITGGKKFVDLRYGENPHQKSFAYNLYKPFFEMLREGKEISYNNIMDAWAAWELSLRLGENSAVVVKHGSPCGASVGTNSLQMAHESDPVSAYGGVYAINGSVGVEEAKFLKDKYLEVLIAKEYDENALEILSKKKNLRILKGNQDVYRIPDMKTAGNIILTQEWNRRSGNIFEIILGGVDDATRRNLEFGWEVIKSIKSNAIVAVDGMRVISSSGGQPNRVDSVKFCLERAMKGGKITEKTILISDGFFPFKDSMELIHEYGINIVAAPLGSIRDEEVIEYAKKKGMVFVKVNERAFKH